MFDLLKSKTHIMRLGITFFAVCLGLSTLHSQSYTSYFTGSAIDRVVDDQKFALTVMGGGSEVDYAMRLFLEDAKGGDILVLRASGSDGYNDYLYSELGIDVNSVETIVCHNREASSDPNVLQSILKAEAIWFAGGDQWKYLSYWRDTPLQQYINFALLDKGIAVGGTSAGMAIMGNYQFTAENGTVTSTQALADPYNNRMTIDNRPFLIMPLPVPIIFDSHFDDRDRRGRMVAFMARIKKDYEDVFGFGLDEKTAARIEDGVLYVMDDTFSGGTNGGHMFTIDCEEEPLEFIVKNGEPLTWSEDQIRHTKIGSGPTDIVGIDLVTGTHNFSPYEDNFVTINNGGYAQEMVNVYGEYSFSCLVISDTEEQNNQKINLVPNPVINSLSIEANSGIIDQLFIISLSGNVINVSDSYIQNMNSVDLSYLPSGLYFIKMLIGEKWFVRKFIKI